MLCRRAFLKSLGVMIGAIGGSQTTFGSEIKPTVQTDCTSAKTFVLWQLPAQTASQMNSYVIRTANGKIIVIDGGTAGDAEYLRGFIAALGNNIDIWFISHQHEDHFGALMVILNKPGDIKIDKIYGSFLDEQWIKTYEDRHNPPGYEDYYCKQATAFNEAVQKAQQQVIEHTLGQIIRIDGVTIQILGIKSPEITENPINNSSVVMRVWDDGKSILFTGDLGVEGSDKLLAGDYKEHLKSDYVQMSHHGQHGATEAFYRAVEPKYCIWPTPLWLWDNDNGGGENSGPWVTLEVRGWMDKLKVQKHYRLFDGLVRVE